MRMLTKKVAGKIGLKEGYGSDRYEGGQTKC